MASRFLSQSRSAYSLSAFLILAAIILLGLIVGCGSNMSPAPSPSPSPAGTTSVAVEARSTSNGQLSAFPMTLNSIILTGASGNSVTLLDTPQMVEFSHLNSSTALVGMGTVPQGLYTSAKVTYSNPEFTYINVGATGGIVFNTDANRLGIQSATVNLPSSISISGNAMALFLDLQVPQSFTCSCQGTPDTYSITPTFNVTATAVSSSPTNIRNGKLAGILGRIVSLNAGSNNLTLAANNGWSFSNLANGPTLSVVSSGNTAYQRVSGLAALTPGMFIDLDAAVQPDGTLQATRIEMQDTSALNVMVGPVAFISPLAPEFVDFGTQQQGDELSVNPINFETYSYNPNAVFQVSGEFSASTNLPFIPVFDPSNMVAGQNVAASFILKSHFGGTFTTADTITLMPQTIDGTVSAISTSGTFTVYRVALPAYDIIPTLNGATSVFAYVDGNTQMFTSSAIGVGNVVRFNGFLFNDAGTLRLVARQVNDGVTE
jgi:hypothetical protein